MNEHKCMLRKNKKSVVVSANKAWSINCPTCGEIAHPHKWNTDFGWRGHFMAAQIAADHQWITEWLPRIRPESVHGE